jgi:hypothetical protein
MVALLFVMIALFEKKKETDYGYLCRQNDRNADMWLTYLCSEQKRYILGTNSEIRKSLQRIRIWRNITDNTMYNISARRATESDYGLITKKDNKPLEFETERS